MMQFKNNELLVKNQHLLKSLEVEFNGIPFDCSFCIKDKCCGSEDENYNLNEACKKCVCQSNYRPVKGNTKVDMKTDYVRTLDGKQIECNDCTNIPPAPICLEGGYLNNAPIENDFVFDCYTNSVISGINKNVTQDTLIRECQKYIGYTSGSLTEDSIKKIVSNTIEEKYNLGLLGITTQKIFLGGVFIFIIFLLLLKYFNK